MTRPGAPTLPDGVVVFLKRECECCRMVAPLLPRLGSASTLTVYTQDDPSFPGVVAAQHDQIGRAHV